MKLNVGNMDKVQTTPDTLPALKKVAFKVVEPQDKAQETGSFKDGKIQFINFTLQVDEPTPYTVEKDGLLVKKDAQGRMFSTKCNYFVDKDEFLGWKGSTEAGYANKDYLRSLKSFGEAIGVDFSTQDIEDAYGRTLRADIIQRKYEVDGEEKTANELRNFRKI